MGTPSAGGSGNAAAMAPQANTSNVVDASPSVTAQDLVDAFKNNGSFDALRNEILKAFTASVSAWGTM